jgi:hypothetical protein
MSDDRLLAIKSKRARLQERAATQRLRLGADLRQWSGPIGLIDRGIAALHVVKSHPVIAAGATLVLVLARPRGTIRWARRGFALWQTFRWLAKKVAV